MQLLILYFGLLCVWSIWFICDVEIFNIFLQITLLWHFNIRLIIVIGLNIFFDVCQLLMKHIFFYFIYLFFNFEHIFVLIMGKRVTNIIFFAIYIRTDLINARPSKGRFIKHFYRMLVLILQLIIAFPQVVFDKWIVWAVNFHF